MSKVDMECIKEKNIEQIRNILPNKRVSYFLYFGWYFKVQTDFVPACTTTIAVI